MNRLVKYSEQKVQKKRISFLFFCLLGFSILIIWRLFQLQIVSHSQYMALAKSQHWISRKLFGDRGKIYISSGDGNYFPAAINRKLKKFRKNFPVFYKFPQTNWKICFLKKMILMLF